MFWKKKSLFSDSISPACRYCANGKGGQDNEMILCTRAGIVSPYYRCKHFVYSPVLRQPKPLPKIPEMDPSDFTL